MRRRILTPLLAAIAAAILAAPASAEAAKFRGKTQQGHKITFVVKGKKISKVRTLVTTFCGQIGGAYGYKLGVEYFNPPGKFTVGKRGKKTARRVSAMWGNEQAFTYEFLGRRAGRKKIRGDLSLSYSFSEYDIFTNQIYFWNCSGSSNFRARRK